MRSGFAAGEHSRVGRLHSYDFDIRIVRFQSFANAAYRTACSDSCDEDIDFAVCVAPDFLCGGCSMPGRVCRVFKLLQDDGAGCFVT